VNRRDFCVHSCQVMSVTTLAALLEACGGSPSGPSGNATNLTTLQGTVAGGVVSVAVDTGSPLASVGGAALVRSSAGAFLVVRAAQDTFNAMTAVCTHQQCDVTGITNGIFECPCHGSQYSSTGTVVRGPATQALRRFTTGFAANVLTINT
jgi:cytochrome b6-f complex iron-sulfur subunit